ncbi:putative carboxylesterase 13 [Hibiscus syriacus]|uniref:Carboxylesterase 13 n=1 Tax=Hibiscus syriacus TaxID=106335 RepID=A0A6A3C0K9_HIBSY|nr:probable carboxylesterase 12 [Hibiscus syriacus]KAE8721817.1 putative carboxylesterase 13 [Hibiscus syriacus]
MEAAASEILIDFPPMLRSYKDGRIERFLGTQIAPPGLDPKTNVESKDVVYSQEASQSARIYIPPNATGKHPLLVYFHGGGFCVETAYSPTYHNYLNPLVAEANIVAVSVDYRLAPEHPLPAAYDDSWEAVKWVASHRDGNGPQEWLNRHADLNNIYFSGDSAGANIAHHMAVKMTKEKIDGVHLDGIVLAHPYFWGKEPVGDETKDPAIRDKIDVLWRLSCPNTSGTDDQWINPIDDPSFGNLGCNRVLVCVAEKDILKQRGLYYCEKLKQSGWGGEVELMEAKGEDHVFHLHNPNCENAAAKLKKVADFINQGKA